MMLNYLTSQALNPNMTDSLRVSLSAWVSTNLPEVSTQLFEQPYLRLPNVDEMQYIEVCT